MGAYLQQEVQQFSHPSSRLRTPEACLGSSSVHRVANTDITKSNMAFRMLLATLRGIDLPHVRVIL